MPKNISGKSRLLSLRPIMTARTLFRWRSVSDTGVSQNAKTRVYRLRRYRQNRVCKALMVVTAVVVLVSMFVQTSQLIDIAARQKAIERMRGEIRVMEANVESLAVELSLQSRNEVVWQRASSQLGMRFYTESDIRVLHTGAETVVVAQTASDG